MKVLHFIYLYLNLAVLTQCAAISTTNSTTSTVSTVPTVSTCSFIAPCNPPWPDGTCCSQHGFCGNATYHCGTGCQSGDCFTSVIKLTAPAPTEHFQGGFAMGPETGIPVMHAFCLPNHKCVFVDKVENFTFVKLPNGRYAYSVEYEPGTGAMVPLALQSNAFCAAGVLLPNGCQLLVGGNAPLPDVDPTVGDGFRSIRYLCHPANGSRDGTSWEEYSWELNSPRWYPTTILLNNSMVLVVSGSRNGLDPKNSSNNNPTYEILTENGVPLSDNIPLKLLIDNQPVFMYPMVFLLSDGLILICVARQCVIHDPVTHHDVRMLPNIPGMIRTYPSPGGSIMLALSSENNWQADIVICGGGSDQTLTSPTDPTCVRINPYDVDAEWEVDRMPEGRVMGNLDMHPNGDLTIINGANVGAEGFNLASSPTLDVLNYDWRMPRGARISQAARGSIARLYHTSTFMDDRGLLHIVGSNPNVMPVLRPNMLYPFPTEFRSQLYWPAYQNTVIGWKLRPTNVTVHNTTWPVLTTPGTKNQTVSFLTPSRGSNLTVTLEYPGFSTHGLRMGHRLMVLDSMGFVSGAPSQDIFVTPPPNHNVAPRGKYRVWIIVDGINADAKWIDVL